MSPSKVILTLGGVLLLYSFIKNANAQTAALTTGTQPGNTKTGTGSHTATNTTSTTSTTTATSQTAAQLYAALSPLAKSYLTDPPTITSSNSNFNASAWNINPKTPGVASLVASLNAYLIQKNKEANAKVNSASFIYDYVVYAKLLPKGGILEGGKALAPGYWMVQVIFYHPGKAQVLLAQYAQQGVNAIINAEINLNQPSNTAQLNLNNPH